jgi:acyl carrier protein
MIEHDQIREAVVAAITEIQLNSGRTVGYIDDELRPMNDLQGFDSLNAVEVSCLLSESINRSVKAELLLSTPFGRPKSVGEIVNAIFDHLNSGKEGTHEQLRLQTIYSRR